MKLTPDTIRSIAPVPPKTETIVFDDGLPGFGVRARLSGWKIFIVQYSVGNRQHRISLGDVDELDVDEARQQAKEILTAVRMGQDPAGDEG
jgi:Arm DNA-binding domain